MTRDSSQDKVFKIQKGKFEAVLILGPKQRSKTFTQVTLKGLPSSAEIKSINDFKNVEFQSDDDRKDFLCIVEQLMLLVGPIGPQ